MDAQPLSPGLTLPVLVVTQTLHSGDSTCAPLAELARVAHGSADQARDELLFFLGNYLPTLPAGALAAFAGPKADAAQPTLVHIDIPLSRPDLPRRLQVRPPIAIPCVVLPADPERGSPGGDRWVLVLPLRHTLHVSARDDLAATVRAEVQRVVAAEERSPLGYLELLPPLHTALSTVEVPVDLLERLPPGRAAGLRRALADHQRRRLAAEVLRSVSCPLPERALAPQLVCREEELAQLSALLDGKERLSVLLAGREGSGKTALFMHWHRQAERTGRARPVCCTSGAQLIAGMSGLGQWQERLRRVMDAAETLDAILYFEDLGDLFSDRGGGFVDLAGAMRPYLAENRVRLCGELAEGALDQGEGHHVGFFGALSRLRVPELPPDKTADALRARAAADRHRDGRRAYVLDTAVPVLIDLCRRYLPYRAFPGKAARLYDEVLATCEKEYDPAAGPIQIGPERALQAFSVHSGIPALLLREDRPLRVEEVMAAFRRRLIGQQRAIRHVAETLCRVKAGLQRDGRPLATFLFAGPTGVGKTELARALAAYLFSAEGRLVRFDMSEFTGPAAAARLISGGEGDEGLLTRRVREQPFCVILLDEIEKAHPQVFDLLLQVLGEGRLTDARGRTASFESAIIILTSNLGSGERRGGAGFVSGADSDEAHYLREVQRAFRPEFIGRLDRIIPFASLSPGEVGQVARLLIGRIAERRGLRDLGAALEVSEAALLHLGTHGYAAAYGARQMRRHLEDHLVAPLGRLLSALGPAAQRARIHVRLPEEREALREQPLCRRVFGALVFCVYPPQAAGPARRIGGAADFSALRRLAEAHLALDRVQEVRDQVDLLAAQLMQHGKRHRDRQGTGLTGTAIGGVQAEHERLRRLWQEAHGALTDLRDIEEMATLAALEGEDCAPLRDSAQERYGRLRRTLVHLLVALEPRRDQAALMLQELDGRQALDLYLPPLLLAAPGRGWQVTLHFDGEGEQAGDPARRLGPPRDADAARQWLARSGEGLRAALLVVRGPGAGALLPLEAGRHRHQQQGIEPAELYCALVALRTSFTDEEWRGPALTPQPLAQRASALPLSRVVDRSAGEVTVAGARDRKVPLLGQGYWERFDEIALSHLLLYEEERGRDRDALYHTRLPAEPGTQKAPV